MTTGEKIIVARRKLEMTSGKLSYLLNMNRLKLRRIELDKLLPTFEELNKMQSLFEKNGIEVEF